MADLLRFATAGSVDDGKSTLIGRLLHDAKALFADQYDAVAQYSRRRGDDYLDLALITDGLRAEREQGITIDVAYRYFATARRKFIIADTPGHQQYTRNMVTGASTAQAALILLDVRNGLTEQSRRHGLLAALLGVQHLVFCVNKMDLVGFSADAYQEVIGQATEFAGRLPDVEVHSVPVSALLGDNVVEPGNRMPWYRGPTLLGLLETLPVAAGTAQLAARFPIQYVIRPQSARHPDYRGYAGQVAGGSLRPGDRLVALPSGLPVTVAAIDGPAGPVPTAYWPMSVVIRLAEQIDLGRGDLLAGMDRPPPPMRELDLEVFWMDAPAPLAAGRTLAAKHATGWARLRVAEVVDRVELAELRREQTAGQLALNEVGRVRFQASRPLFLDPYEVNRHLGGLILVDEATNRTVGAAVLLGERRPAAGYPG